MRVKFNYSIDKSNLEEQGGAVGLFDIVMHGDLTPLEMKRSVHMWLFVYNKNSTVLTHSLLKEFYILIGPHNLKSVTICEKCL